MTPNEKDRETAREVMRHSLPLGAYAQFPKTVTRLEDNIAQALHSTRISALKEAAEVLKPFAEAEPTLAGYTVRDVSAIVRAKALHDEITKTLKELEK